MIDISGKSQQAGGRAPASHAARTQLLLLGYYYVTTTRLLLILATQQQADYHDRRWKCKKSDELVICKLFACGILSTFLIAAWPQIEIKKLSLLLPCLAVYY
jgi:hypothetical protein